MTNSTDQITVVVAVDDLHLSELQQTLPTWIKYKNFNKFNFLVLYDASQVSTEDDRFEIFKDLRVTYVPIYDSMHVFHSQREKMLTALTIMPAFFVTTPWYLKIDTDCIATNSDKWYDDKWLDKDYVFISNPWGYTKPSNAIDNLDKWAVENNIGKPLNLPFNPDDNKIKHERIISWLFLCKTSWNKEIVKYLKIANGGWNNDEFTYNDIYSLPFIDTDELKVSQDTTLWYLATITNKKYKLFKFKDKGWDHKRIKIK